MGEPRFSAESARNYPGDFTSLDVSDLIHSLACAEEACEELRGKLQRVRDWMKFQANSDGGIVAEIDGVLASRQFRGEPF